ncbi:MAG: hypothetical protein AAF986_02975 [Pseudomonadota bacterium]
MGIIFRATSKLVMTFVVTIALFILSFMYFPQGVTALQDAAQFLEAAMWEPPFLTERATVLFRTFINDSTLLGVITTAVARVLIEAVSYLFGGMVGDR